MNNRARIKLRPLRRLLTTLLAIPLILLLLRLAWGAYADHHLAATRRELAAQGHRVYSEDFTLPPLPDDQNAAIPLLAAAQSLTLTAAQEKAVNADDHRAPIAFTRWTGPEMKFIRDAEIPNVKVFELLDAAAQRPDARWPFTISYSTPAEKGLYRKIRVLANFLYSQAIMAHEDGHDDLALADLLRITVLANRLNHGSDLLLSHLVAVAITAIPPAGVERIHLALSFDARDSLRARARQLIAVFRDDQPADDQLRAAFERDAACADEFARTDFPATQSWLTRPAFKLGWAGFFRMTATFTDAISVRSWQTMKPLGTKGPECILDLFTFSGVWPANSRAALLSYRSTTDRHAAAILLAAALYRADHHGKNPATLNDLIPTYLPAAPMDRFASPPVPLHYRPTPELIVWSVGENGVDDGGSTIMPHPYESWRRWDALDAVYGPPHLEPLPSTAPTSPSGFGPGGFGPPPFGPYMRPGRVHPGVPPGTPPPPPG